MNVQLLSGNRIRLLNCTVSYPHLFQARSVTVNGQPSGDPRFTANFITPALTPAEQQVLNSAVQQAITDAWGASPPQIPQHKMPFKDATGKEGHPSFAGRTCISGASPGDKPAPDVVRVTPNGLLKLTSDNASELFGGCLVHAEGRFFGYKKGSNGVSFGINSVVLVDNENVTRLDNRMSVTDSWGDMYGSPGAGVAATDPMTMGGPVQTLGGAQPQADPFAAQQPQADPFAAQQGPGPNFLG